MNTKKWLAVGSCVTALGLFSACSDDSSPAAPITPESSSAITPTSSGDVTTSSSDISTGSSSSATNPVLSSSGTEDVVDSSYTNMGVS